MKAIGRVAVGLLLFGSVGCGASVAPKELKDAREGFADAEKGTRPDAWRNPALVKAGTYEDEPQTEPTPPEAAPVAHVEITPEPDSPRIGHELEATGECMLLSL